MVHLGYNLANDQFYQCNVHFFPASQMLLGVQLLSLSWFWRGGGCVGVDYLSERPAVALRYRADVENYFIPVK